MPSESDYCKLLKAKRSLCT